jgi:2,3-dihydroxybenzoate-AMP ligase
VFVVLCDGATSLTLDRIRSTLTQHGAAKFKLPEHLELVDALPLTNVGKIDKKALRAAIAARLAPST